MIHFHHSKILIPVDFSETSMLAIKHGAYIAKHTHAELYLLHVVNMPYPSQDMFLPHVSVQDESSIEQKVMARLGQVSTDIKSEYGMETHNFMRIGNPSNEIGKFSKEKGISLVVIGTHGYSPMENLVIGSVALKILTKSACPVMAMSSEARRNGYNKIVVPIDNTANSRQKMNFTMEFAKKFGATVHAIGLLSADESQYKGQMEQVIRQVEEVAKEKGVTFESEIEVNVKNRATATVSFVEKIGGDLVIIMTDQDAELSGFFLGPYSQQVIHHSKVPVIAIKPADLYSSDDVNSVPSTSGS